jgi:hypothetical protein
MLRPLLSGGKLLAALIVLYVSGVYRIPVIVVIAFGWSAWIWFVGRGWRVRLVATLGFGLIALGWWFCFSLWGFFAQKSDASHTSTNARYWGGWASMSFWEGFGMSLAGVMLLICADYLRSPRQKQASELKTKVEADQSHVWPPAPKQPQ